MKILYRVSIAESAPHVELEPSIAQAMADLSRSHGQSFMDLLGPGVAFKGKLSKFVAWNEFYAVIPGCFAISEVAWDHCMKLYYGLEYGGVEIPFIKAEECSLRLINPVEVLPDMSESALDGANFLFRIADQPAADVFCLGGTDCPRDEFKYIYDHFGFLGLVFEEVWRG